MIIQSYGLFWRADEIEWYPGKGKKKVWRLLGRRGARANTIEMAEFRDQTGIYILYGNYGPHYVGLTRKTGFGKRLKDHMQDDHKGCWDRFSWFGFKALRKRTDADGLRVLRELPMLKSWPPSSVISDIEALLIKSMALQLEQNEF